MHELLRQFTEEELDASPTSSATAHDQHCAYFTAALAQRGRDLKGRRQPEALAKMDVEIENVGVAWKWAVQQAQLARLDCSVEAMCRYYILRGRYQECEVACAAARKQLDGLSAPDAKGVLASVLRWQAASSWRLGRGELACHLLHTSVVLLDSPALADQDTRAKRACILTEMVSVAYLIEGDDAKHHQLAEQSLVLYEGLGDRWGTARALQDLAWHALLGRDDYDEAKLRFEEALGMFQVLGDQWGFGKVYHGLGMAARGRGELEESELLLRKAVGILGGMRAAIDLADARLHLGMTLIFAGRFAEARQVAREDLAINEYLGETYTAYNHLQLAAAERHRGRYDRARTHAGIALQVFRQGPSSWMTPECVYTLGCVELAEAESLSDAPNALRSPGASQAWEAYGRAQQLLQEAVAVWRETHDDPEPRRFLASLATTERALGNRNQAMHHLQQVLHRDTEAAVHSPFIPSLSPVALLLTDTKEHERAVEVYALACRSPYVANSRWFEDVFGRHIEAVAATLPPEVAEAARARGCARDLKATMKELLAELK